VAGNNINKMSNPATEAAGPVANLKLGGGLLSNNITKITT